ncbi:hypothetical protein QBC47DRAFT_400671 [Echria macrotheca]|uniref:Uncharacterized protein n=1 Tax=Echria macrotheca TaxID=438768 RepID=A0AAJ0BH21_9PEZI|nr:hypothetical protein QBC47DRAFT_400671 [Echria macrotheca]
MGQNLSGPDLFADPKRAMIALAPFDRFSDTLVAIIWGCSFYGIGMIFCAVQLLARWSGKHGERGVNIFSILAAFILAVGWPLILIYLARTNDRR